MQILFANNESHKIETILINMQCGDKKKLYVKNGS